jgi:hypothetical protein
MDPHESRSTCTTRLLRSFAALMMVPTAAVAVTAATHPTTPAVVFQTIFGGTGQTRPFAIAVDRRGNSYVAGVTLAADFPATPGAFQTSTSASETGFVVKLDPSGTIVYATYLGGTNAVLGIAVDARGQVALTGQTSGGLPTRNAAQGTPGGGSDAFVMVLNTDGSDLIYSTYLGGSDEDEGTCLAIDRWGRIVVGGWTSSIDFPSPRGPLSVSGSEDGFVAVLDGGALEASDLVGGSGRDEVTGLAVSERGRIYLAGVSSSSDFPTLNPVQAVLAGGEDAFVSVFDASLNLRFSTFLGGANNEAAPSIAVDRQGDAYVAGRTGGAGFPLRRPLQPTPGSGGDFFVTKIDVKKARLVYSTYLGGSDVEDDIHIAVDHRGRAYLAGTTESSDFPEVNPIAGAASGLFQAVIGTGGGALIYSTRLPSVPGDENVFPSSGAVTVDSSGDAYVAGWTNRGFAFRIEGRRPCGPDGFDENTVAERGRGLCR